MVLQKVEAITDEYSYDRAYRQQRRGEKMKKLLLGVFPKHEDADTALFHLKDTGIESEEISIIAREDKVKEYRSRESGGEAVVAGGLLGGIAGLLIAATPVVLPGVGILIAGPLTVLTGLAMGAVTGGLLGALVDVGISESQARRFEKYIKEGGILLAVPVSEKTEAKARGILKEHNAEEITVIPYTEEIKKLYQQEYPQSYQSVGMKGGKTAKRK